MSGSDEIIQLKIRLLGISPMIWRRVLVPASISLRELHGVSLGLDLSRFSAAPNAHLCSLCFESQGAFPA